MFSIEDPFDFDSTLGRHIFDNHHPILNHQSCGPGSSSGSDFFLCDDNSTDSECSGGGYNSDQENNEEKM